MTSKNPSIILVRPQLPENIGMVARVMHNFGLKDLIVVSPRDNWLNNKSINAAKKATKIIKNIKVYDDLEIALSNFSYVVATTNRKRYLEKNSTNDFKFIKRKIIVNKKTAILFGPENSYQLSKFLNYVIEKLENKKFFTPSEKKESMKNNIYSIFTKIPLTKKELQTLWGITKKLNK